jgi:hypothetical protein
MVESPDLERMLTDISGLIDYYKQPGVVGIVLYGSWAKGVQTDDSDVDIGVLCENQSVIDDLTKDNEGCWYYRNYAVEITFYDYQALIKQDLPKRFNEAGGNYWTESNRLNWLESKVLYDPQAKTQELTKLKAVLPESERLANLSTLGWILNGTLNFHIPRYLEAQKYTEAQILMNKTIEHVVHHVYNNDYLLMPYSGMTFYWFKKQNLSGLDLIEQLFNNAEASELACQARYKTIWEVMDALGIDVKHQTKKEYFKNFFDACGAKNWDKS